MTFIQRAAIAAAAFVIGFSSVSYGQIMRAKVPFNFHVGDQLLPAGQYEIRADAASRWVLVTPLAGAPASYVPVKVAYVASGSENTKLIFAAYGNVYFLHRVQHAGSSAGTELFSSATEREIASVTPAREVALVFTGTK
jgi:hypothetical protein